MKNARRLSGAFLGLLLLAAAGAAPAATEWVTDPTRSRLVFTAVQAGGEFDGRFQRFRPAIRFDPGELSSGRFDVVIETGSADTGDTDRDALLSGSDFFATDRWPTARFEATRFSAAGPSRYDANGLLTIRDVTRPVTVSFAFEVQTDGRTARLSGSTVIQRLEFGVGQGEWRDTTWVGDDVKIRFELLLQRK